MLHYRLVISLFTLSCMVMMVAAASSLAAPVDLRTTVVPDTTIHTVLTGDVNVAMVEVANTSAVTSVGTVTLDNFPPRARLLEVLTSSGDSFGVQTATCTSTNSGAEIYTCRIRFRAHARTTILAVIGVAGQGSMSITIGAFPSTRDRDTTPGNARVAVGYTATGPNCTVFGSNGAFGGIATAESIVGTEGSDVLCGFGGRDMCLGKEISTLSCTSYRPDVIKGLGGDDTVLLPAVNSTPAGRAGDMVDLGDGTDTVVNADSNALDAIAQLGPNGSLGHQQNRLVTHTIASAEGFVGGPGYERVTGSDASERIDGRRGGDVIRGGGGDDHLLGGAGDDDLDGGPGNDALFGNQGDDSLAGNSGIDSLDGGEGGFDVALASIDAATIDLNARTMSTGTEVDTLVRLEGAAGGAGDDTLIGSFRNETFFGSGGSDTVDARGGIDILSVDWISGAVQRGSTIDATRHTVSGGTTLTFGGIEGFVGTRFADVFQGSAVSDLFFGEGGNDVANGLGGMDEFEGGLGNDTLRGGAGRDTLTGDAGRDTLVGGIGPDGCRQETRSRVYDC